VAIWRVGFAAVALNPRTSTDLPLRGWESKLHFPGAHGAASPILRKTAAGPKAWRMNKEDKERRGFDAGYDSLDPVD
jgi:hypothetical protein